jgi:hypothetical protein
METLTRKQIAAYQRRRRWAPLLLMLFPFIGMPVALASILVVGFSLEWMGFQPGPPVGAAVFLLSAGTVMFLLFGTVRDLRRCPGCRAVQPAAGFLTTVPQSCRACGQHLTTDAFDAENARRSKGTGAPPESPPTAPARLASDEEVRKFRSGLRKGRVVTVVWAGSMLIGMVSFVGLPHPWLLVVIPLMGMLGVAGALGLNLYILTRTCPHCRCGFGWLESGHPWTLPDFCAACNQSLLPEDDKPIKQRQRAPYGKRES